MKTKIQKRKDDGKVKWFLEEYVGGNYASVWVFIGLFLLWQILSLENTFNREVNSLLGALVVLIPAFLVFFYLPLPFWKTVDVFLSEEEAMLAQKNHHDSQKEQATLLDTAKFSHQDINLKTGRLVTLREFSLGDLDEFDVFRQKIARETTYTNYYVGMPPMNKTLLKEQFQKALSSPYSLLLVAVENDRIVGFLDFGVKKENHVYYKHVASFGLMILEEFWGQGVGGRLLEASFEFAKKSGIKKIEARVREKNSRAIALYQKKGFVTEGCFKGAAVINSVFEDEIAIAKFL